MTNAKDQKSAGTIFDHAGLICKSLKTSMGHYCGYVAVPKEHPWHGLSYNDTVSVPQEVIDCPVDIDKIGAINLFLADMSEVEAGKIEMVLAVDVHGGLTYANGNDDAWWFGFDCAHAGDARRPDDPNGIWRDEAFVIAECKALAEQLASAT